MSVYVRERAYIIYTHVSTVHVLGIIDIYGTCCQYSLSKQMIECFDDRYCHPPPPGCPRAVYEVMVNCW